MWYEILIRPWYEKKETGNSEEGNRFWQELMINRSSQISVDRVWVGCKSQV